MQEHITRRSYPKRYVRSRTPRPMRIREEDVRILELFLKYRYLTPSEIVLLLGPQEQRIRPETLQRSWRPANPETMVRWESRVEKIDEKGRVYWQVEKPRNLRAVQNRLHLMFQHGMVTRPPRQRDNLYNPGEIVHGLGNRGADLLAERGLLERGSVDWQRRSREVGEAHIEHTRMISRVRMALTLALPAGDVLFNDTEDWKPEGPDLRAEVVADGEPVVIKPDAFFRLKVPGGRLNFLLECVRNNTERRHFLPRLKGYWYGQGFWNQLLGIRRYRVLVLSNGEDRRDSVVNIVRHYFNDGQGSNLFLCGTEHNPHISMKRPETSFRVEQPESLLGSMWRCGLANCAEWHQLVE